jgi:uncharacterized protein
MNTHERDPYEDMTNEAFEKDEKAWADIDAQFDFDEKGARRGKQHAANLGHAPQPVNQEEKNWVTGVHASALLGYVFPLAWLIGPLVVWLAKREEIPAVDVHGRDVLNFQITMLIAMFVAGLLSIILIGIPVLIVLGIVQLVATILGTIKASQGERFKYPWSAKFL